MVVKIDLPKLAKMRKVLLGPFVLSLSTLKMMNSSGVVKIVNMAAPGTDES